MLMQPEFRRALQTKAQRRRSNLLGFVLSLAVLLPLVYMAVETL